MAAIEIFNITDDEVDRLLYRHEGHFLDFKAKEIAPAKLSKSISAFANADGGELLIGANENNGLFQWSGFNYPEDANAIIQVVQNICPLGRGVDMRFLKSASAGFVLQMDIHKVREIIFATDKVPYIRRSAQNVAVTSPEELQRLRLDKGIESYETSTIPANVVLIANSTAIIGFILEIVPHQEPEIWLTKQQLIISGKPTVAGAVLFADLPQALIPKQCGIKIYRYKSSEDEGTRDTLVGQPVTVEGYAYQQIYDAVSQTKALIESIRRMTPGGLVSVSYPEETLHEIITNAVLHRDYSIADDVHIRVYDNRVEIESPGVLPGHVTIANILDTRFARNGNIVRLINKFPDPPNKDIGEGLNTAFRAMEKLQLKKPTIEQTRGSVLVTIKHERLGSAEDLIVTFLDQNDTINNGQARELCVIREDWRIRKIFADLVSAGMIEKVEGSVTSNTAYRKKLVNS